MIPRDAELLISAELLGTILRYDPVTGQIFWLFRAGDERGTKSFNARFAGVLAGGIVLASGYVSINLTIAGKPYHFRAHRIAWALHTGKWPPFSREIDHRNNIRADNAWSNLRLAKHRQNGASKKLARNNSTGFKGVTKRAGLPKPWKAQISANAKRVSLGYYSTPEQAAKAYDIAATNLFGQFAKTNSAMGLFA